MYGIEGSFGKRQNQVINAGGFDISAVTKRDTNYWCHGLFYRPTSDVIMMRRQDKTGSMVIISPQEEISRSRLDQLIKDADMTTKPPSRSFVAELVREFESEKITYLLATNSAGNTHEEFLEIWTAIRYLSHMQLYHNTPMRQAISKALELFKCPIFLRKAQENIVENYITALLNPN